MGRHRSIDLLPTEQREQVNQCIRLHRYMNFDAILADIQKLGIKQISRSALGRYLPNLRAGDELKVAPAEDTIVTIVERSTGEIRVIKTSASAAAVAAQIAKIGVAGPVS